MVNFFKEAGASIKVSDSNNKSLLDIAYDNSDEKLLATVLNWDDEHISKELYKFRDGSN